MAASKQQVVFYIKKTRWLDGMAINPSVTSAAFRVGGVIAYHLNSETGETFVGRETIADLLGINVKTVDRAIVNLEKEQYLRVVRSVGRTNVNTYSMAFPEKAPQMSPFSSDAMGQGAEIAPPVSPFTDQEMATFEDGNGDISGNKRPHQCRPNLKDLTLSKETLENSIGKNGAAAPSETPRSAQAERPPAPKRMTSQDRPKTFKNRGQFEQRIAELISEAGGDGWDVLMGLDDVRVAALCRRLKNGVLTQQEVTELCGPRRRVAAE